MLQLRDLHHTCAAEGLQGIVGETALAQIAADRAGAVIGGESGIAHRLGLHASHAGPKGVVFSHRFGNYLLEIHSYVVEEVLREVSAVETNGLVGIFAGVVVPIEERAAVSW